MNNLSFKEMPPSYSLCVLTDCPLAGKCLRGMAYAALTTDKSLVTIVNPKLCKKSEECPHYRSSEPQKIALGLKGMQAKMVPAQYNRFMNGLINAFGKYNYYKMRKGELPISIENQKVIKDLLDKIGAPNDCDFDAFEERTVW